MIAIPFIYFSFLAWFLIRKHEGVDISAFVVLVYAFSAFCSILLDILNIYNINGVFDKIPISPVATISYCALITLAIIPFSKVQSCNIKDIDLQKPWIVDLLSWVLIFTFLITLYNSYANIETLAHTNLKDIRDEVYGEIQKEKLTGIQWLLALPSTLFSQFSPIAILIYFINIAKGRKSTIFNLLILSASLTPVLEAALIAGRTQPIYWFLSFMMLYIFFRPILSTTQRHRAILPFWVIGGVVLLFIGAITISRFATKDVSNDTGTLDSLIAYSGQSFVNFNYFFCNYHASAIHFDRIFPLTNYFIIHPGWNLGDYRDMIWSDSGLKIGVFFTFLGDLLIDLGNIGMWVYILLYFCISKYVCKTANEEGTIRLSRLLVILILILIPLQGVFYYSYYKVNIGYFIVGTLIICWILSHTLKSKYEH